MEKKVFENRNSRIWLADDGIIRQVLREGAEQTLTDAKEDQEIYSKLCNRQKIPTLIDISAIRSITREARLFYSQELAVKYNSAMVLVVGSQVSRVIANFMLGLTRPAIPIRLASSQEKGLNWLKQYL